VCGKAFCTPLLCVALVLPGGANADDAVSLVGTRTVTDDDVQNQTPVTIRDSTKGAAVADSRQAGKYSLKVKSWWGGSYCLQYNVNQAPNDLTGNVAVATSCP
jgi:hypothetical protein